LSEISLSAKEQSLGAAQVSEAVAQLDSITQQNAAMVEELAAAASSLNGQVGRVGKTIRVFKLTPQEKTLAEEDAVAMRKEVKAIEEQRGSAELDFEAVLAAHQQWRVNLRNAINRKLSVDADKARRDDCSELGQWLYGPGKTRWGRAPAFTQLVGAHKTFHAEAGKVADVINQKKYDEAGRMVGNDAPFHKAGQVVSNAIRALRQAVEGAVDGAPSLGASSPRSAPRRPAVHPERQARPAAPVAAVTLAAPSRPVAPVKGSASAEDDWETF